MSLKFLLGFLLAFLSSVFCGNAERLDHECVSRREFEERLGQLESRLFDEIKLRQKLEAEVEDMRASLDKTIDSDDKMSSLQELGVEDAHGHPDGIELSDTEQPDAISSSSSSKPPSSVKTTSDASTRSTKSNLQRKTRSIQGPNEKEAFTVELQDHVVYDRMGLGQTIRFDNIVSKVGHGFDTRTGIFTATYHGWYVFALTMKANDEMEIHIVRDGVTIARCWQRGSNFDSTTQMVVTHLDTGSEVWVQTSPAKFLSQTVIGSHHTTFTGFLLYAD